MSPGPESWGPSPPAEPVAIPEHMVVLLLEGGQLFLKQVEAAMGGQDQRQTDFYIKKVLAILKELDRRLNHEEGGELVNNLVWLYDWWGKEILAAGAQKDAPRLRRISAQMGENRQAWEQVLFKGVGLTENPDF